MTDKEIIQKLVLIRKEKGWTQTELAEKCGLKQAMIGRLESGKSSPTITTLIKIATVLEYTLDLKPTVQK